MSANTLRIIQTGPQRCKDRAERRALRLRGRARPVYYLTGRHHAGVEYGRFALVFAELAHEAVLQQGDELGKLGAQASAGCFAGAGFEAVVGGQGVLQLLQAGGLLIGGLASYFIFVA